MYFIKGLARVKDPLYFIKVLARVKDVVNIKNPTQITQRPDKNTGRENSRIDHRNGEKGYNNMLNSRIFRMFSRCFGLCR